MRARGPEQPSANAHCAMAPLVRRFVVIGQQASASNDFSLDDLPGSSGRLDVLLRCVRAALLVSHGLRRDVVVYLVLLGGRHAPRGCLAAIGARSIRVGPVSLHAEDAITIVSNEIDRTALAQASHA